MNYGEAIKTSMDELAKDKKFIFLGYNVKFGSKGYGTFKDVPENQKIETPLAENLMIGLTMGLSLEGYVPVLFFERHDFMLIALDGIINHLDKIEELSYGEFKMPLIIRATIGSTKPINPGIQHIQDFTDIFKKTLKNIDIFEPKTPNEVINTYKNLKNLKKPAIIIERKDLYKLGD